MFHAINIVNKEKWLKSSFATKTTINLLIVGDWVWAQARLWFILFPSCTDYIFSFLTCGVNKLTGKQFRLHTFLFSIIYHAIFVNKLGKRHKACAHADRRETYFSSFENVSMAHWKWKIHWNVPNTFLSSAFDWFGHLRKVNCSSFILFQLFCFRCHGSDIEIFIY